MLEISILLLTLGYAVGYKQVKLLKIEVMYAKIILRMKDKEILRLKQGIFKCDGDKNDNSWDSFSISDTNFSLLDL